MHLISQQGNPPTTLITTTLSALQAAPLAVAGTEVLAVDQINSTAIYTVKLTVSQLLGSIVGTTTSGVVTTSGPVSLYSSQVSSASTGTVALSLGGTTVFTVTPTGNITYNATTAPIGIVGQECVFVVTTSGVSSFNITFGTNFKSTGVLATGTVSGKVFTVSFVYDGTNWNECGRTVAM